MEKENHSSQVAVAEEELSPEQIARYSELFDCAAGNAWSSNYKGSLANWKAFRNNYYDPNIAFETRKLWVDMKKEGADFERFLVEKMRQALAASDQSKVFKYVGVYINFGAKDGVAVLSEALNHKTVWADMDGSSASKILDHFRLIQDPNAVRAVVKYIENIFSDDYARVDFRSSDLFSAIEALYATVGEEAARSELDTLAAEISDLKAWFDLNQFVAHSFSVPQKIEIEEFDLKKEEERLRQLEEEASKAKKVAPGITANSDLEEDYMPFLYEHNFNKLTKNSGVIYGEKVFKNTIMNDIKNSGKSNLDLPPEPETPEQREVRYKDLLSLGEMISNLFLEGDFNNSQVFKKYFQDELASSGTNTFHAQTILVYKEIWFKIKKEGEPLQSFLRERIKDPENNFLYDDIRLYILLGYADATSFVGELLSNKEFIASNDLDAFDVILDYFCRIEDTEAAERYIMRYIENLMSSYVTNVLGDIEDSMGTAVSCLGAVAGRDKAMGLLEDLAQNNSASYFQVWFAENKRKVRDMFIPEASYSKIMFEDFDPVKEAALIAELRAELEEKMKQSKQSLSFVHHVVPHVPPPTVQPAVGSEGASIYESEDMKKNAKKWEEAGHIINFYGRFAPRLERGIPIEGGNYHQALVAASNKASFAQGRETYFAFLSGAADEELIRRQEAREHKLHIGDLYRIAALAYARAISSAFLDHMNEQAIEELGQVQDLLQHEGALVTDKGQAEFIAALALELSVAQRDIKALAPSLEGSFNLPKSADSFLMHHTGMRKVREIPDFSVLLAEKIKWLVANDLAHNMQEIEFKYRREGMVASKIDPIRGPSFKRIYGLVADTYREAISLYKAVEDQDAPLYWEASRAIEETGSRRLVVFGRDGRHFFTALKAGDFGFDDKELSYVVITSDMSRDHFRNAAAKYLKQNGVTLDYIFIDTGYIGTVPEFAIQALATSEGVVLSEEEVDRRIKLLSSNLPKRRGELSRRTQNINIPVNQSAKVERIESRPKNIDRPESFVVDEKGLLQPEKRGKQVKDQLLAWVAEHVVIRNFAPKLDPKHLPSDLKISPEARERLEKEQGVPDNFLSRSEVIETQNPEQKTQERESRFKAFIDGHCGELSPKKKEELLSDAMRLYEVSRDIVGPVLINFARWSLDKVKPGENLLFLARDALAPWIAARLLVRAGEFPQFTEDQLRYAYLSRRVMSRASPEAIKKYLSQLGIEDDNQRLVMVDVGVYGAVHQGLKSIYPKKDLRSLFLISKANSSEFDGYLYDGAAEAQLPHVWSSISGNPAVHFLEGTFSGFYGSAEELEFMPNGTVRPVLTTPYSRDIYLKRLAALTGVIDRVSLGNGGQDEDEARVRLEEYLDGQFKTDSKHIAVPHE